MSDKSFSASFLYSVFLKLFYPVYDRLDTTSMHFCYSVSSTLINSGVDAIFMIYRTTFFYLP